MPCASPTIQSCSTQASSTLASEPGRGRRDDPWQAAEPQLRFICVQPRQQAKYETVGAERVVDEEGVGEAGGQHGTFVESEASLELIDGVPGPDGERLIQRAGCDEVRRCRAKVAHHLEPLGRVAWATRMAVGSRTRRLCRSRSANSR